MISTLKRFRLPLLVALGFGWAACGGNVERGIPGDTAGHGGEPRASAGAAGELAGAGAADAGAAGESAAGAGAVGGVPPVIGPDGEAGMCAYFEGDAETPELCEAQCGDVRVNFLSDWTHCGGCNIRCEVGSEACLEGKCVPEVCRYGSTSCTHPGCQEYTDVLDNCGACGVKAAPPLEHAVTLCGCRGECEVGVCAPGYANCDRASNDCETALATGGACTPKPGAPWCMPVSALNSSHLTMTPDGALFIHSEFAGEVDFDPSSAVDLHQAQGSYGGNTYVTKFNADGSYAWTRTWPTDTGAFLINGLRAGSDGSLAIFGIAAPSGGTTKVSDDLDPGPEVDLHTESAAVVMLDANGSYSWGRTWGPDVSISDLALDSSGRVYAVGRFSGGKLDADPGAGTATLRGNADGYGVDFLLSLDAAGEFRWAHSTTNGRCTSVITSVAVSGEQLWAAGAFRQCAGKTDPAIELPISTDPSEWSSAMLITDLDGAVDRTLPLSNYGIRNMAIGSTGNLYFAVSLMGDVDFDPGAGVAQRAGSGGGVLAWSDNGAYRWVRAGGDTISGFVSPGPDGGVLASAPRASARNSMPIVLDSEGIPLFTVDITRWSSQGVIVGSSAAGFVIAGENKATCPNGLEVQPYTW